MARFCRNTLAVLTLLLVARPCVAQPSLAPEVDTFREEIEVRLVELEVVVTDGGRHVTGLGPEDFEVRQGRKQLEIAHFAAFDNGEGASPTASGPGAMPWTVEDRLHLVIYLDHAFLQPGELGDVITALRAFLRHGPRPKDRVMLVEANQNLSIRQGFTTVHDLISAELGRIEPQAPRGRAMAEFPRVLQEIERVAQQGADVPGLSRTEHPMILRAQIESFAGENHQELERTTHQLHRLIPALAGLPGRKEILYIGGTLPTNAARQLYNAWNTAFGPSSVYQQQRGSNPQDDNFGRLVNTAPEAAAKESDTSDLFRQVAELANANGVKLHVLDTGGLRSSRAFIAGRGGSMTRESPSVDLASRTDTSRRVGNPQILRMMAETTGGRALINSRAFDTALDDVARDLRTYYILAFYPPKKGGGVHEIKVRLKNKKQSGRGLELRHSRSYRSPSADRVAAGRAVSALILGEADNPLRIELIADPPLPVEGRKGQLRLPLHVLFPLDVLELLADERGRHGQLSFFLTSGDLERGAAEVKKAVLPLHFSDEEWRESRGRHIDYKLELPIAAGSRRVAVVVRDDLRPLSSAVILSLVGNVQSSVGDGGFVE